MPQEDQSQPLIDAMFKAYNQLIRMGWREAIYCPKDGTVFDAIEAGSTGIHPCFYDGEWPTGSWWIEERTGLPDSVQAERKKGKPVIRIYKSETADTRTCDYTKVSKETLLASSTQHISDVRLALDFFMAQICKAGQVHDPDKLTDIDGFHADFVTGFKQTDWWARHRKLNRHHLTQDDGVPDDVNLIDVLDFIADCVMAGMARSGSVYPLALKPELLERAFQNTIEMLKREVVVDDTNA